MNIAIQVGDLSSLNEAINSNCDRIRFGSEFCMFDIPPIETLTKAYEISRDFGKDFVYITPRLSDNAINTIKKHLQLLNDLDEVKIVVNDLGTLKILREFSALKPHLGRQLIYMPSRTPWKTNTENPVSIFMQRKVNEIFYQTSLNYKPTLEFFKNLGVIGIDVDWIPEIFPNLTVIKDYNFQISVNLHSIPVVITRKCHMARFVGVENLDACPKPCHTRAYFMKNQTLNVDLYLNGNVVYKLKEPTKQRISSLEKQGINELVLNLNPLTRSSLKMSIGSLIKSLKDQ